MLVLQESYTALLVITGLLVLAISLRKQPRLRLPPSPLALPIIGHLYLLGPMIHQSFHNLSLRYGPLIYLRLGSINCIVASDPEVAKEFLKTHELTFSTRNRSLAIDHITYNAAFAFAPYGPYWKFIKKITTSELVGTRTLNGFLPVRRKEYREFLGLLMRKSQNGEAVNISQELLTLATNIVFQMMMSIRCSGIEGQAHETRTIVREVTKIFGEFNVSDLFWFCRNLDLQGFRKRYVDIHSRYDALIEKIIKDREQVRMRRKAEKDATKAGERDLKDFLDTMLDVLEDDNSDMKITRDNIKALALDFITASTDTSGAATDWALAELINHPRVLKKARNEIEKVVGKSRLVEESDLPNLVYVQAILKETFRLHPPIPLIIRKATENCNVNGYDITENTMLFVNTWSIGRDPKYWENPMEFRPERFLPSNDQSALLDVKGHHYQLLPFGTGRRGCPGLPLVMQEVPTVLAAMIQCFDWKVLTPNGEKMNGGDNILDMTERSGLTVPRFHDLICVPVAQVSPNILDP